MNAFDLTSGQAPQTPPQGRRSGLFLKDLLETIALALFLFMIVNTLSSRYEVRSISMQPTLYEGQYLVVSKIAYWFHPPQRGDIVVLDPPHNRSDIPYIKRVVGLPGEHIRIHDGRVWIDGVALNEPYVSGPVIYSDDFVLKPDEYLVLGDNRNNSSDSHVWGPLPRDHIIGKTIFRYWPLENWGTMPTYAFPELEARP